MSSRAETFAQTLLSRMRGLEAALLDEAAPDKAEERARRQELIAKLLGAEGAPFDQQTVNRVLGGMPSFVAGEETNRQTVLKFARFLADTLPALA